MANRSGSELSRVRAEIGATVEEASSLLEESVLSMASEETAATAERSSETSMQLLLPSKLLNRLLSFAVVTPVVPGGDRLKA